MGIKDRKLEGVDHLSNKRKNDLIQAGFDLVIPKLIISRYHLPQNRIIFYILPPYQHLNRLIMGLI